MSALFATCLYFQDKSRILEFTKIVVESGEFPIRFILNDLHGATCTRVVHSEHVGGVFHDFLGGYSLPPVVAMVLAFLPYPLTPVWCCGVWVFVEFF